MKDIILASASPRRKELLDKFNIDYKIEISNIYENVNTGERPEIIAMVLAFEKAVDISKRVSDNSIIISADTIVVAEDNILEKPKTRFEAKKMLELLSGKMHKVITGISLVNIDEKIKIVDYEKTFVKFRELNDELIEKYLDTGEYKDKAGSYGIQGKGSILVEKIEGCYYNVVGLPLNKLDILLREKFNIGLI